MATKRVELGDVFYVPTNFGIAKGHIVKIIESIVAGNNVVQFKLNIDDYFNERTVFNLKCGFFYTEDQLYKSPRDLIEHEMKKWKVKI
jgi:hypothetical protein